MMNERAVEEMEIERLRKVGGDALVLAMIDLFFEHAPVRLRTVVQGAAEGAADTVERAAHSLKTSAAHLGARALSGRAEALEAVARERRLAEIREQLPVLEAEFSAAWLALEQIRSSAAS